MLQLNVVTCGVSNCKGLFAVKSTFLMKYSDYRGEVFQVEWDPNHETVLASSGEDRRLMVWDLNRYVSSSTLQNSKTSTFKSEDCSTLSNASFLGFTGLEKSSLR